MTLSNNKSKILSLFVAIAMVSTVLVIVTDDAKETVAAANDHEAFTGTVIINGNGINDSVPAKPDAEKTGISYDADTYTLTLDNATIKIGDPIKGQEEKEYDGIFVNGDLDHDLYIILVGTNTIEAPASTNECPYVKEICQSSDHAVHHRRCIVQVDHKK